MSLLRCDTPNITTYETYNHTLIGYNSPRRDYGDCPTACALAYIVKATGPNQGTVTFRALIEKGWHLYGLELPKDGPKPTEFNLEGSKDIELPAI